MSIVERSGLQVRGLRVTFDAGAREVVRGVSFDIAPGEAFGLVGESGSGKSLTCRAVLGLLPLGAAVQGDILFDGMALRQLPPSAMQKLRGSRIAMIFQDPTTSLNPVITVRDSVAQVVRAHCAMSNAASRARAVELLTRVGIRNAARRSSGYPHQFSGGMRQRVLIAMALAAGPTLLLADEPTSALDVIVQAGILDLLDRLRREDGMSLLLVSHDIAVIAQVCSRIGVMYAGQLLESGPTRDVIERSRNPYTQALLLSVPDAASVTLRAIPGSPPEPGHLPEGCVFHPRCPLVTDECRSESIALIESLPGHFTRCIHADRVASLRAAARAPAVDSVGSAS
jgi:oligopeptide/dipeptide ABC transporter ATP-binding protein